MKSAACQGCSMVASHPQLPRSLFKAIPARLDDVNIVFSPFNAVQVNTTLWRLFFENVTGSSYTASVSPVHGSSYSGRLTPAFREK